MNPRLEHANICVRSIDIMTRFLQTAFPDFRIRSHGISSTGTTWAHIGTDETYIALNLATNNSRPQWQPYSGEVGVNHLAYEVNDVEALRQRLIASGYRESTVPNAHPHRKRIYFYDPEGNDWEFVQYVSQDPAERNDYVLPDL